MGVELEDRYWYHTDGPNCHWCWGGATAFVWGPYGTHICQYCTDLIDAGRPNDIAETVAAAITVRDNWHGLDPERWRQREHARLAHWLTIRTTCTPVVDGNPPTPGDPP